MNWSARVNVLYTLSEHAAGAEAIWAWVVNNWDLLKYGRGKGSIGSMIFLEVGLRGLSTTEHLKQVEAFFSDKMDEVNTPTLKL
jgi:hypothetical protein